MLEMLLLALLSFNPLLALLLLFRCFLHLSTRELTPQSLRSYPILHLPSQHPHHFVFEELPERPIVNFAPLKLVDVPLEVVLPLDVLLDLHSVPHLHVLPRASLGID